MEIGSSTAKNISKIISIVNSSFCFRKTRKEKNEIGSREKRVGTLLVFSKLLFRAVNDTF
jgi:hypothetical protein